MTEENYYLAFYQAILDRDLMKLVKLKDLTNEERLNYPEEYPHLDANEIFKANHPMDFINTLLITAEYKELYLKYDDETNPLATEENIALRERTYLELLKHPLIDYCPSDRSSIIESLLAVSYSKIITKAEVITKLTSILNQSLIIDDVLSVTATSSTISQVKPFSIALIDNKIESYDPTKESNVGGYNNDITNRLVVTNEDAKLNLGFIIHELAHKIMHEVFGRSEPYNNESSKNKYHTAIKNTLLNIQEFIKQDFGLEIKFEDQNDTWQKGKTLSTMLFPQSLESNGIQEFISSLKKYNLNINDQFSWLDNNTPLSMVLRSPAIELADELFKAGAKNIHPETIHIMAIFSTKYPEETLNSLNWILTNIKEVNINDRDHVGMTALDYAENPQMIKVLISAGAIAYPPNYQPVCSINIKTTSVKDDRLKALESLLSFYNQNYGSSEEDAEFIVRLPQIIASGLYKGKIVEMLEPLAEYWQEVISPAAALYQEQHDTSEICLAPLDYADFF